MIFCCQSCRINCNFFMNFLWGAFPTLTPTLEWLSTLCNLISLMVAVLWLLIFYSALIGVTSNTMTSIGSWKLFTQRTANSEWFSSLWPHVISEDILCRLTVCAAKWQVAFFKKKPNEVSVHYSKLYTIHSWFFIVVKVKEYIRRAKAWRNKIWPKGEAVEGRPSSYLMSLLVLRAFEIRGPHETLAL